MIRDRTVLLKFCVTFLDLLLWRMRFVRRAANRASGSAQGRTREFIKLVFRVYILSEVAESSIAPVTCFVKTFSARKFRRDKSPCQPRVIFHPHGRFTAGVGTAMKGLTCTRLGIDAGAKQHFTTRELNCKFSPSTSCTLSCFLVGRRWGLKKEDRDKVARYEREYVRS